MSDRKLDFTIPIQTTPEELWKALTEAKGIEGWFAPEVRVVPGEGGSIWMSWGEGMAGEAKIEVWDPERHLRTSFGPQSVDYFIETKGTETVLRLVQSGFGADASFDGEYESSNRGWTIFLSMLKHGLERHPGVAGENVTLSRKTDVTPAEAWKRIAETGELKKGTPLIELPPAHGGFKIASLNDAYLAIFCEGKEKAMVTVTWILYGLPGDQVDQVRSRWASLMNEIFPSEKAVTTS
jgi:uncharacterized protein YndB with AHSA1/START domain